MLTWKVSQPQVQTLQGEKNRLARIKAKIKAKIKTFSESTAGTSIKKITIQQTVPSYLS